MIISHELECLLQASLSSLVWCLGWGQELTLVGCYFQVLHSGRLERLVEDKHSSLFRTLVSYDFKQFYNWQKQREHLKFICKRYKMTVLRVMHLKLTYSSRITLYTYMHTQTHTHIHTHTRTHIYIYYNIYYTNAHTYQYIYICYIHTNAHTYQYIYIYITHEVKFEMLRLHCSHKDRQSLVKQLKAAK
jgi:hypothetical protein